MKLILREEVENLGDIGDVVEVADGYGRNFLIPKGLAIRASDRNVKALEHEKRVQAQRLRKAQGAAEEIAARLEKLSLRVTKRVGEGDRLYGSVTAQEIAAMVQAAGEKVDRRKIQLESPIRSLGAFKIPVKVHPEVTAELNLSVVAEAGGTPPAAEAASDKTASVETPPAAEGEEGAEQAAEGDSAQTEEPKPAEG
jgi:large subunit ribosomal protein L9